MHPAPALSPDALSPGILRPDAQLPLATSRLTARDADPPRRRLIPRKLGVGATGSQAAAATYARAPESRCAASDVRERAPITGRRPT